MAIATFIVLCAALGLLWDVHESLNKLRRTQEDINQELRRLASSLENIEGDAQSIRKRLEWTP